MHGAPGADYHPDGLPGGLSVASVGAHAPGQHRPGDVASIAKPLWQGERRRRQFTESGAVKLCHPHANLSTEGTSGNSPGHRIDPIEYARGQLAAFAHLSATLAREVHILRLRNSFERAGIAHQLRYSLRVLNLMREAQELGGGYWFPTPLRVVPMNEHAIVVGPIATRELRRHFPNVTRAGYARVCQQSETGSLPRQDLDDWLGLTVLDSVVWTEAQIKNAKAHIGPTLASGKVEYLTAESKRIFSMTIRRAAWTNNSYASHITSQGVVLCRERLAPERFRYFFGKMEAGHLTAEGPSHEDVTRLQFGLAALVGMPFTVGVSSREGQSVIHLPPSIPRPERQLVLALCTRDYSYPEKAYRLHSENFAQMIVSRLRRLGCEVRSINA